MKGKILNITRFCVDDGPGIRTTVFLKGCPLRCLWCHNPESQSSENDILYDAKKCVGCLQCVSVCPNGCHTFDINHQFNRNRCVGCGICAQNCPSKALEVYGQTLSVSEVYKVIEKDKTFYNTSNGGVTISGGEPLFQPDFTAQLLKTCQENGIHTVIETSGFASKQIILSIIPYCDFVLFDIKETNAKLHKEYTGVPLEPILNNLKTINQNKIPFIIRAPIIPTLNDREEHFRALKELRLSMEYCHGVQIMPYHSIGSYKYEQMAKNYVCREITAPTNERVELWKKLV